ncbi:hypothetical protein [Rhizobium mongolense]|uniref:Uncharacterized protein n=2 Tax=Rhizobium mongolense TaxID=57676 RepID=A0ABR6IQ97_9HYPH|nr:hypothetical protein [Rhizobium mongolense]MBB4230026.1 hypothetical protein [Rhizobium mongolense]TVZ72842.1 hypothetical protein BCL32_1029 [Rhizobium mongolense USDA 1844]
MAIKRIESDEDFRVEYPRVREWLLEALKYSTNSDERGVLAGLIDGSYSLWTGTNSAAITQNMQWDNRPVCILYLVAGDLAEILGEGHQVISTWAKANGCEGFVLFGRPGWQRVLAPHGFEFSSIVMFKEF